jgi:hypothetical protein
MGLNISWTFVDEIDRETLFAALDLAPTEELSPEHKYDLGTTRVPLAGATFKSGWCAVFAHCFDHGRDSRHRSPASCSATRKISVQHLRGAGGTHWCRMRAFGRAAATSGKFDTTEVMAPST